MVDITIIMPTYNKEKYIAEALDSVFMQETAYSYQIIITDDCSNDATLNIVKEYQEKYPDKIILLPSEVNQKLYKNILRAYSITKTDYFCVLDPDDYWTDKFKIQKALDFLENNKDFTIYATATMQIFADGTQQKMQSSDTIVDSDFNDFINQRAKLGCTLGAIFRNVIFKNGIPEKMLNITSPSQERSFRADSFRNAIHIHEGKAHYVPEFDAMYRITEEGIWQGTTEFAQNIVNANIYKDLFEYFDCENPELLQFAYKLFQMNTKNLYDLLKDFRDDDILISNIRKSIELYDYFSDKKQQGYNLQKKINLSLKNRIRIYFYHKLSKKLSEKGLI